MRMDNGLTGISNKNLSEIRRKDMTAQEIIAFLESGALYRTFRDVLSKVYKAGDLKSDLTDGLYRLGGGKRESVARNVRNWLNGTDVPRREQLFKICFVLGLDDVQASQVIASISETGIHYRNPEELIYAYCLRMGRPYEDALVLKEDLLPEILTMSGEQGEEIESVYTRQLQRAFEDYIIISSRTKYPPERRYTGERLLVSPVAGRRDIFFIFYSGGRGVLREELI